MADQTGSTALEDAFQQDLDAKRAWLQKQSEPLDEETIELCLLDLENTLAKCNRLCNLLLNRQAGLGEGVIIPLSNIKVSLSELKWFAEQRPERIARTNATYLKILIERHLEDEDHLGVAARSLSSLFLPDAPEA